MSSLILPHLSLKGLQCIRIAFALGPIRDLFQTWEGGLVQIKCNICCPEVKLFEENSEPIVAHAVQHSHLRLEIQIFVSLIDPLRGHDAIEASASFQILSHVVSVDEYAEVHGYIALNDD